MKKFKISFIISLFIVLILTIGSISAENINSDDSQILNNVIKADGSLNDALDSNIQSENSLDEIIPDNAELNHNALSENDLHHNIVDSDVESDNQISENIYDEDVADDFEIANDINVSFPHKLYKNDTANITIELPEEASGNLRVTIDEVEIYNETIVNKSVQVPITIPKSLFSYYVVNRNSDYRAHKVAVFYNGISLDFDNILKIMWYEKENGFYLNVPEEILKDDNQSYQGVGLVFPYSANGTVDIYIDDELFQSSNSTQYLFLNISKINCLDLGTHRIRANFSGDDYYLPCQRNATFNIVDFLIDIPSNVSLDHNDCIYAKSVKHTDGTITVLFDGKVILAKKLDKNHEFLESLFSKVTCGEHLIEVQYNSTKFNYSKQKSVNITYVVDIWGTNFMYGEDNTVCAIVPPDFNASLVHISIDGISYPIKIDNSGWIDLNVSKLTAGNHTLIFNFEGDGKYYPYDEIFNFTVSYGFKTPDFIDYLDGSVVSIALPSSANGNFEIYIDDVLYKSVKFVNGKASVRVDDLCCGNHNILLNYTGDDFEVENCSTSLNVHPKITYPFEMECGKDKSIIVQVSKNSKGKIIFTVGKNRYNVTIKDGKAVLSLKNLKIGEYDIDIDYLGDDGRNSSTYAFVDVVPAKIKISGAKNLNVSYTINTYYKVKVYDNQSKLAKGAYVNFKVGKTTYKVKTDKNGVAKLKLSKFAPKSYKIIISCNGTKVSKKLTVKHILKLKSVKVRKNAKKLVLTASLKKVNGKYLKGKLIKFKFKGKTYKAKTNSKGIAKVTIKRKVLKKLKIGKKVTYKATYLKDTAKRTVKVRK